MMTDDFEIKKYIFNNLSHTNVMNDLISFIVSLFFVNHHTGMRSYDAQPPTDEVALLIIFRIICNRFFCS